ncbi:ras-associated and pleckstrin homology domains-containing protein 1 [Periplaneta americana]|uniref:ras-associated and pleckstrin homology domains-containing protein 1 n=1 Tax=Periplaneta americana TaxID=6978 RepID=UPI0037E845F6
MAARWRGRNPAEGDEVQRSLELLDRVLSEFDDLENGNAGGEGGARAPVPQPAPGHVSSSTPEDESPSLGGHQSEDDGYMSMNGRRAKFVLSFRPVPDEGGDLPPTPDPPPDPPPPVAAPDFPPPPEEAERIISTLLPRVSPGNSAKRSGSRRGRAFLSAMALEDQLGSRVTTATQTTLPKSRHQRPHAWESAQRFGSLPYWLPLPPRTVPGAVERHREVRRRGSGEEPCLDELTDDANFSEDSLEELLPPPPASKRSSIAWEVPLDDADPLLTPGSTKVVGRRRRRSGDHSSTGSIPRPASTEDEAPSPFSDSYYDSNEPEDTLCPPADLDSRDITPGGTYVIRKGRRKERRAVPEQPRSGDLKRCSSTFDNIKSLLREGLLEGLDEAPPDFSPPAPPALVRVVSLPSLAGGEDSGSGGQRLAKLDEEETDEEARLIEQLRRTPETPPPIEEFPPLPPSPVEERDDEYSEILHPSPEPFYRSLEPSGSDPCGSRFRPCLPEPPPPPPPPHQDLKTRSMDAGFSRGPRNHSRKEVPAERRTLPSELPGPLRRRTFQKRGAQSPREEALQTSCSLPETPIFARGCDIPRTPHRRAPEIPSMARTAPRPGGLASGGYSRRVGTGVALGSGGLSQALAGAELLRLAGGPGRGWYPRHRQQPRPASIEHLDRLAPGHSAPGPWESARDARKPLTLPPNLSPKFFHRSPREALRRVTSLLIRKGSSPKEPKKDALSPTRGGSAGGAGAGTAGEVSRQKRGFFKNFWKRSRHYSLEQQ